MHEHQYNIHGVYRPPSFDVNCFLDKLEEWMSNSNSNHSCLILGDLNIPINLTQNNVVMKYITLIESYGMVCSNTFTTRPSSNNLLDHVVCRLEDVDGFRNDTIFTDKSDHTLIISTLKTSIDRKLTVITKSIVNHRQLEFEFRNFLNSIEVIDDVSTTLIRIQNSYSEILSRCTRTVSNTIRIKRHCPWISFDLSVLIKMKNNYLKRVKRNPNDINLKNMLNHVSKKVQHTKNVCKKQYFEKLWKNIN